MIELKYDILRGRDKIGENLIEISHYHEDHAGLIRQNDDCPVYMWQRTYKILEAMGVHRGKKMPQNIEIYRNKTPFKVGEITVTT